MATAQPSRPLSKHEIRLLLVEWGDLLIKRFDAGDSVEMWKNTKRPDVLLLVAIASKVAVAEPVVLQTMEAGA